MEELNWTGERLVTKISNHYGTIEHLHRYAIALDLCKNKIVLDIASGEGYGTNLLSSNASHIYGIDISNEAIEHSKRKYNKSNITFETGSTSKIPLRDSSIDVVVSFETIEHHNEHEEMMLEIKRVLKPSGILIISSPEKSIYKERDPNNPFHIKELTLPEFQSLINSYFNFSKIYTQRFIVGSVISRESDSDVGKFKLYDGSFDYITNCLKLEEFFNKPYFNFIICSDEDLYNSEYQLQIGSFFNGYNVYSSEKKLTEERYLHIGENKFLNSTTYKVGKALLRPFTLFKTFFAHQRLLLANLKNK